MKNPTDATIKFRGKSDWISDEASGLVDSKMGSIRHFPGKTFFAREKWKLEKILQRITIAERENTIAIFVKRLFRSGDIKYNRGF